jgi:hypothetical protein
MEAPVPCRRVGASSFNPCTHSEAPGATPGPTFDRNIIHRIGLLEILLRQFHEEAVASPPAPAIALNAADEPLAVAATQSTVAARYRLPRGLLKLSSTGGRWKTRMLE